MHLYRSYKSPHIYCISLKVMRSQSNTNVVFFPQMQDSISTNGKSLSPWILSSYKNEPPDYPDSLIEKSSIQQTVTDSESHRFQTANTFLWETRNDFYDSIDSNMASSSCYYRSNGEDLAECDSLERELLTNISFGNK